MLISVLWAFLYREKYMATYSELYNLKSNSLLHNKVEVAIAVAAQAIHNEATNVTNHANRAIWAKQALENPMSKVQEMTWAILVANADAPTASILGASDAAVQSAVNNIVNLFATG